MPNSSYGEGNWVHSRSSSSAKERDSIIRLVRSSNKPEYQGIRWSGNTDDPHVIRFANEISVQSSTMQTKIRAFIRFGFIKDGNHCPLIWSDLGKIWRNLISKGKEFGRNADSIEELIIASALAIYAFDSRTYSKNPINNYRPLYELLKRLDSSGFISDSDLKRLIAGNARTSNFTYWKKDLKRSGLFKEDQGGMVRTRKFQQLTDAIMASPLPSSLSDRDWDEIHDNMLSEKNPYGKSIKKELDLILEDALVLEVKLPDEDRNFLSEMASISDYEEASEIGLGDYRIPSSYSKTKTRKKQSAWSKEIKKAYRNTCCVPECDIKSPFLVIAAHIKDYSAEEAEVGHRANPQNGLCLCLICHALFDLGYFTLTDDLKIQASPRVSEISSNLIRGIIERSDGKTIKLPTPESFNPNMEFIRYHKENHFL